MQWDVGSHISFSGKLLSTVRRGVNSGMNTIQFFMGDYKSAWKREKIEEDDIIETKKLMKRFHMNIFSHYPFCANFAGKAQKGGLAWKNNNEVNQRLRGVIRALEYELSILANFHEYGRCGVVIHPGSYYERNEGHLAVAQTINLIDFPKDSVLLLENCAGEGNKLCRDFEEIQYVLKNLEEKQRSHVKVCVDTAHIWGQGDYDLREKKEIDRLFRDFQFLIGLENLYLLHLNDSKVPLGSKKDVHEDLGEGYIWKNRFDSLVYLLNKCKEYQIPMVLETHETDLKTLLSIQPPC